MSPCVRKPKPPIHVQFTANLHANRLVTAERGGYFEKIALRQRNYLGSEDTRHLYLTSYGLTHALFNHKAEAYAWRAGTHALGLRLDESVVTGRSITRLDWRQAVLLAREWLHTYSREASSFLSLLSTPSSFAASA